jgi:hypothetical protein
MQKETTKQKERGHQNEKQLTEAEAAAKRLVSRLVRKDLDMRDKVRS